ncbi:ADP-ribose pyrophosphatase, mitochondrial [Aix galericulata]|nr:ADP-ribose pyrophosphatase, mitochondrial [Aix galericulata]
MVDPGEKISATLRQQFGEGALSSLQKWPDEMGSLGKSEPTAWLNLNVTTALATARTMLTMQDSKRSFILSETPVEQMAQSCSAPVPAEGKAQGARTQAGSAAAAGSRCLAEGAPTSSITLTPPRRDKHASGPYPDVGENVDLKHFLNLVVLGREQVGSRDHTSIVHQDGDIANVLLHLFGKKNSTTKVCTVAPSLSHSSAVSLRPC